MALRSLYARCAPRAAPPGEAALTVIVDVGAARYDHPNFDAYSMERLIKQFRPTHLYAYDPNPALSLPQSEQTQIELHHIAVWTCAGSIGYEESGPWSRLTNDLDAPRVPCIDLAEEVRFLSRRHSLAALVLKLDCEGAEYVLLPHLIACDVDKLLDLILVEWHPYENPYVKRDHSLIRAAVEANVRCEMREWCF